MRVYRIIIYSITSVFSEVKHVYRQKEYPYAIHAKNKGYIKPSCRLSLLCHINSVYVHSVNVGFSVWGTTVGI